MCVVGSLFLGFTAGSGYAGETSNKITANKISSNRIAANRLVANKLSSNKITANGLQANLDTSEILQTEDGREVYSYMNERESVIIPMKRESRPTFESALSWAMMPSF